MTSIKLNNNDKLSKSDEIKNKSFENIKISKFDENINTISKYLWDGLFTKFNHPNFNLDLPLFIVNEIDNIQDICCHIYFTKKFKVLSGSFYIHSSLSNHPGCICKATTQSLFVNKDLYFYEEFIRIKLNIMDFSCDKKFTLFRSYIHHLFYEIISKLKFDIFYGNFLVPGNKDTVFINSLKNIFNEINNIKTIGDKCCICLEETATLTNCNHSLCICCYNKMKKQNFEKITCPLCRNDI